MDFYLINGGPRKKYNTSKILDAVAEGINDELLENNIEDDVNIELIDLYDLDYKGCKSCFHCKKIEGKFYGQCPIKDDLLELLPKLWSCDALVLASPIYFGNVTGQMKSFIERLIFPKYVYGADTLSDNKPTAFIYTMNVTEELSKQMYENTIYDVIERYLDYTFGAPKSLKVYDTYQFKDYSLYENYIFDEKHKAKIRDEVFPKDLEKAYDLGKQLVKEVLESN